MAPVDADMLYRRAIEQLIHNKIIIFMLYSCIPVFLQARNPNKFEDCCSDGLVLAKKYHYRFLQCRFEQLLEPTDVAYDSRNNPLPDGQKFSDYIQFLIK